MSLVNPLRPGYFYMEEQYGPFSVPLVKREAAYSVCVCVCVCVRMYI